MTWHRRGLLKALGAATLLQPWMPGAIARARTPDDPFSLGVASGSPADSSVVLWTRLKRPRESSYGAAPVTVGWEIAADETFRAPLRRGSATALPELGHSVHVELDGLAPGRWYFYRFLLGDAASPTGRTRTFPAAGMPADAARFALASCQWWQRGFYAAYRHMAAEQPDAVLFAGDYIYEYPDGRNPVRRSGLPGKPITLEDYRRTYDLYRSDPHLQAMHAACPWLMTWDDHEVYNDYAREQGEDLAPNFLARKFAAYQAYYEYLPLPAACLTRGLAGLQDRAEFRLYRSAQFGQLARILILDDRQYRDAQACPRPGLGGSNTLETKTCDALDDPARTLLGRAQEQWLAHELAAAGRPGAARWTVILQQTLLSPRVFSGQRVWTDGWDGYPHARQRLLDTLRATRPSNPVILGGDVHESYVSHVHADFRDLKSPVVAAEFCGTSISSTANTRAEDMPGRLRSNPHMLYGDPVHRGYLLLELADTRAQAHLRIVEDATREDSGLGTGASFALEAGSSRISRI